MHQLVEGYGLNNYIANLPRPASVNFAQGFKEPAIWSKHFQALLRPSIRDIVPKSYRALYSTFELPQELDLQRIEFLETLDDVFDKYESFPVGRSGFPDSTGKGSSRINIWSPNLACRMTELLWLLSGHIMNLGRFPISGFISPEFEPESGTKVTFLQFSPLFRFMSYEQGGGHNVHHDSSYAYPPLPKPYRSNETLYTFTSHSFVFFLDTLSEEDGGGLYLYPSDWRDDPRMSKRGLHDWTDEEEQAARPFRELMARPKRGTGVMFPHSFAHGVEDYRGSGRRRIIRGDIISRYTSRVS